MIRPLRLNPVALKELRQLVRSRVITWGIVAFPLLLLAATALTLAAEMHGLDPGELLYGEGLGEGPFVAYSVILGIAVIGGIPVFSAIKTTMETVKERMSLEFITALTPADIISGKLTATAILMAITTALAMPFFAFAYLMRGIPLGRVLLMPLILLAIGVAVFSLLLPVACQRRPVALRIVLIILLYTSSPFFAGLFAVIGTLGSGPYATRGAAAAGLTVTAFVLVGLVSAVLLSRAAAAAVLSPPHLDSVRTLRKTEFALLVISAALIPLNWQIWSCAWIFISGLVCLRCAFADPRLPEILRRNASPSALRRLLSFPFATGGVPGMLFGLCAFAAAAVPPVVVAIRESDGDALLPLEVFAETAALMMLVGGFVRFFRGGRLAYRIAGAIGFSYLLFANLSFVFSEFDVISRTTAENLFGNVYGLIDDDVSPGRYFCGGALLAVVTVFTLISARREYASLPRPAAPAPESR